MIRRYALPDFATADVTRFLDALAFNWVIGAPDAHAKNYSIMLEPTAGTFAPLYDVISVLPYTRPAQRSVRLAMRIGSNYRISDIDGSDWRRTASTMRLDPTATAERIGGLITRVPEAFARSAADPAFANRLTDLIANRARLCTTQLETSIKTRARHRDHGLSLT